MARMVSQAIEEEKGIERSDEQRRLHRQRKTSPASHGIADDGQPFLRLGHGPQQAHDILLIEMTQKQP